MNSTKTLNKLKPAIELGIIFCVDLFTLILTFHLAVLLREKALPKIYAGFSPELPFGSAFDIIWIFLVWLFFFYYEGFYTKRFSFWDEIRAHWRAAFFSTVGIFTIVSLGRLSGQVSRTVIVLMGVTALALVPVVRMTAKKMLRGMGLLRRRVLILGAGETGRLIANAIRKEPNYGFEVVGYLDDDPEKIGTRIYGAKVHKGVDSAPKYIVKANITDVIIAMPGATKERVHGLINTLQHRVENLLFVPDAFGMAVIGTNLMHFFNEQAFALELRNNLDNFSNILAKRIFDYLAATVLLFVLAIPILVIALIIKATSPGPAIYRQERIGRNGRPFVCLKFRTMHSDAEERLKIILEGDPAAKAEWQTYWKLKEDPRVTAVGRYLRSTSLDELPQLLNVVRGDMSLVGPRPVTEEEIAKCYKDAARLCFSVLPGITGLWQVSGRSDTSYDYRLALDSWYLRNWNLWLDIVILFKTFSVVLRKQGAR